MVGEYMLCCNENNEYDHLNDCNQAITRTDTRVPHCGDIRTFNLAPLACPLPCARRRPEALPPAPAAVVVIIMAYSL